MITLIIISVSTYGQDSLSVMDKLMATTWKGQLTPDGVTEKDFLALEKYTTTNQTGTIITKTESYTADIGRYYLSDTVDTYFDNNKVGKVVNGKYIVTKRKENFTVYEILKLDSSEFIFKNLTNMSIVKYKAFKE